MGLKKKLKIAHILHSFGTGGMEKGVATLVGNASSNVEHIIICLTRSGNTARLLPPDIKIIEIDKPRGNSIRFLLRLSRVLKTIEPDVVHTRNWGGTDGIIAARFAGIRSVVHSEHGFGIDNPSGNISRRIWLHRLISPFVQEYIGLSKILKNWFKDRVRVQKPVTQIYNGIDTQVYYPGPGEGVRKELGLSEKDFVIGIVASLNGIKDHTTLIRAFTLLKQKKPDSILLIAGDGPERSKLESIAVPGVLFLGNRNDIPDLMRSLDIFVLSSINEGISNTILEAMSTGLPVVASNVGGNPELVADGITGTLFPPGDSDALASILLSYLSSADLRHQHGSQGRNKAIASYSIKAMVDSYESVWKRVAQVNNGKRRPWFLTF